MHCRFRLTEGTKGNLPLRYDWEVDGLAFHNPYPIGGGSDLPDFDARFDAVDAQWRRPSRGVTLDDYEALAKATPGLRVARAKASADPVENRISVTVVPYSRNSYAMPDDFFCARVCRHLDTKRLITTRIRVTRPRYSRVALDVRIKAHPRHEEATLRKRVTDTIDHYLHPLHGGDDRKGWPFGRPVYLSDIYALLETVEGVDCIMSVTFSGEGHYDGIQKAFRVAPESLIRTTTHRVTFVRTATACGGEA
jgi:predicted phage baseplate assembly protein